jgi:hypothetical protein
MELRAYLPNGIKVWDVESPAHGWRVWAAFSRDLFFARNATKVTVVPKGSPL